LWLAYLNNIADTSKFMAEFTNQAFNPNFAKESDIESMISAPLVAVSKANVIMTTGQTRFLLEYCFTKGDNNVYAPIMIEMFMTKGIVDETKEAGDPSHIKMVQLTFSIPLLCIIPINSLAVDKVSIDFNMEITSVILKETRIANESKNKVIDNNARLNGKIGSSQDQGVGGRDSKQYKRQVSNRLKININASPLPLPVGVLTILDLYTKAIQPIAVAIPIDQKNKNSNIPKNYD
jgi:hypothetical protein